MEDERHQHQARDAWATKAVAVRWDYWLRVEWSHGADPVAAQQHLERFVADLHRTSPGIRLLAGVHRDPMPHAHLALKLSRRLRARFLNAAEGTDWLRLYWRHGPVWCAAFDRERLAREHVLGRGAVRYLARDPGTVVSSSYQAIVLRME